MSPRTGALVRIACAAVEHVFVQTSAGPFGFIGRLHTDRRRPSLLAVNGSFPQKDYLHDLPDAFPGANVLMVHVPGMGKTPWSGRSAADLTIGLQEAVSLLFRDLPLVVFSASTGNLLALGLTNPNICRRVCVEPFFQTERLWPFIDYARGELERHPKDAGKAQFLWDFFGITPDRLENRDYRHLLDCVTQPTDVVCGSVLLGEPPDDREVIWPSFTLAEEREALAANPLVTLHPSPPGFGHAVAHFQPGKNLVNRLNHGALRAAAELCLPV
ncbi:hypothetical protein [Phenylobacterium sp.]|uniref:hypothetical protein n=1 Tax=Phenylobacterium sp. TaxID=1871053 RepID=UPI002E37F1D3|nr:hypothetical protein [Phenylobacterium sp.]HEX3366200.1 hypothetical protein [Phenylobacterium sp.]